MAQQIQLRNGTAAQWASANPTLAVGELGVETDTNKFKVGTGSTAWNSLSYSVGFTWRGTWSSATAYAVNDLVTYGNASYISIQAGTNQTPGVATSYWTVVVSGSGLAIGGANTQVQYNNAGLLGGSANLTFNGTTLTTGGLSLKGSTSGTVTIAAPATAGTQSYTLPTGLPASNGYVLSSTTAGVMSWAAAGGASEATPTTIGTTYGKNTENATAGGYNALANMTGIYNTAFGWNALTGASPFTGQRNSAFGFFTANAITSGSQNACFAMYSGGSLTTANWCTLVGYTAGGSVTTGDNNTMVGALTGTNLTIGTGNTLIGYKANVNATDDFDQIVIGNDVRGQADTTVTIGNSAGKIYNAYTSSATWTQTSDGRLKTNVQDDSLGLSFINRLRPVTFNWKASPDIDPSLPYYNEVNKRDTTTVIHGLVAQEVKAALDAEGCSTFNGWDAGNEDTIQAISREMFISPLIKAIQELTARVASLESQLNGVHP
jgi:hypothetical protein